MNSLDIVGIFVVIESLLLLLITKYLDLKINQNVLKIIAIIAMTIDHVAFAFIPCFRISNVILRIIGRITFPILIYCVVEGYKNTKSLKKYAIRLLIFALISQIPYELVISSDNLNPIFSMLISLIFLMVYNLDINKILKVIAILIISYLSTFVSYGAFTLVLTFVFFLSYKNKMYLNISYLFIFMIEISNTFYNDLYKTFIVKLGLLLPLVLLNMYSNERKPNKFLKYAIYIYYPLHLLIIYTISKVFL